MPATRDVVLGYNHGYNWNAIAPFINSLRDTGFTGEVGLFTSGVSSSAINEICSNNVTVIQSPCQRTKLRKKLAKLWAGLRFLPAQMRLSVLRTICPFGTFRYFLYAQYLAEYGSAYRQVMLTDIRDVVFQRNPFDDNLARGVHLFEEDHRHTIRSEGSNTAWVQKSYGTEMLNQIGLLPILCAGTILGDAAATSRFLDHLCRTIAKSRSIRLSGIDQGIFNVAVRACHYPELHSHKNGESTVLTMGLMGTSDILLNDQGYVVRANQEIIPVLHQFDRHPEIAARLRVFRAQRPLCEVKIRP
jgi:hypothetical protein